MGVMRVRLWRDAGARAQVNGHEKMLVAALRVSIAAVKGSARASGVAPVASQLRPVPYLMYIADGNSDSHFNIFEKLPAAEMKVLQRIFRRHPEVDCSAGAVLGDGTGGAGEYKARRQQIVESSPEGSSMQKRVGTPCLPRRWVSPWCSTAARITPRRGWRCIGRRTPPRGTIAVWCCERAAAEAMM